MRKYNGMFKKSVLSEGLFNAVLQSYEKSEVNILTINLKFEMKLE